MKSRDSIAKRFFLILITSATLNSLITTQTFASGGTWANKTSMETTLYGQSAVALNGILYEVGGATNSGYPTPLPSWTSAYDPSTDSWSRKARLNGTAPYPCPSCVLLPSGRAELAAIAANGKIYAIGGGTGNGNIAETEVYDPTLDAWSFKTSIPTPRSGLAAQAVDGIIYAIGGYYGRQNNEAYNIGTNAWSTKTSMPTGRAEASSAVVNGIIYVIGGVTASGAFLNTVEAYNPVTDTWTTKTSMPTARGYAAAAVVNDIIYVIGGETDTGSPLNTVEAYNPAANTWSVETPMTTSRTRLSAAAVGNVIYAVGGGIPPSWTILDTNEAFAPASGCTYSISPTSQSFTSSGGTGSVTVTASSRTCAWTAASSLSWVTITSGSSGKGSGTVTISVSANTTGASRTGNITIAGQTFAITQSGSGGGTTTNLLLKNLLLNPDFESGSVNWTEYSSGGYSIIINNSSYAHGGSYYAIMGAYNSAIEYIYQDMAIPSTATQSYLQFWYWISTYETTATTAYDAMAVEIRKASDNSLLTTLATLSNLNKTTGWTQSQQYDVSAYKGQTIRLRFYATTDIINATAFRVDDVALNSSSGSSCTYTITPTSKLFTSKGGSGTVTVKASPSTCTWTATESLSWVSIKSGSKGTGNGTVKFSVSANNSGATRTGSMIIAGKTFVITQTK